MSFEADVLKLWDKLAKTGDVVYSDTEPTYHDSGPIKFEIRVSPTMKKKPLYPPYASLHEEEEAIRASKPPFSDPLNDPTRVTDIGPDHTLVLNKYSFQRPQFILHTTRFQPQEDLLNASDFAALADLLTRLDDGNDGNDGSKATLVQDGPVTVVQAEYMAFFNCGGDAGASVAHKHIQLLRRPDPRRMPLWPDGPAAQLHGRNADVPFKHRVATLAGHEARDAPALLASYARLCRELDLLDEAGQSPAKHAHSFVLTRRWIVVIPRSKAQIEGCSASAISMLGMIWCGDEKQKQRWLDAGLFRVINELAVRP